MSNKSKTKHKAKEPVKLRFKPLINGNKSIYLDIYQDGNREYEFLKLYLVPERTPIDKHTNKEILQLAETIKAQKIIDLNSSNHNISVSKQNAKADFIEFAKMQAETKKVKSGGNERGTYLTYQSLIYHCQQYTSGRKTTFKQIDKHFCNGFIDYLQTATSTRDGGILKPNTQISYIKTFEAILNAAIKKEIIIINPMKFANDKPTRQSNEIIFLTKRELNLLDNTECIKPKVKAAFLFACYTGLRFSDIKGLTWGKFQEVNNSWQIVFRQKKTDKMQYLPIATKAMNYLPDKAEAKDSDTVFDIPNNGYCNVFIRQWALSAGIKKHVSFHVARHSCATLLLALGENLKNISEILGHSNTQITEKHYAAITPENLRAAVNKFDLLTD
jgi:integrase